MKLLIYCENCKKKRNLINLTIFESVLSGFCCVCGKDLERKLSRFELNMFWKTSRGKKR